MLGLQTVGHSVLDLMFPPRCRLCGRWMNEESSALCECCQAQIISEIAKPACPRCAATLAPFEKTDAGCGECRGEKLRITATARVVTYRSGVGRILRGYKFHRREEVEPLLSELLLQAVLRAPWRWQFEAVVPVPTIWHRRLWRATYPAETLAAAVARKLRVPCRHALRRIRGGPRQIDLTKAERHLNVLGAFVVEEDSFLEGRSLLLIDDIRTTGATLEECARVLMKCGVGKVFAAVACGAEGETADWM
ncbi:MAG: double zinc ribbon domain-containing protein [Planctomycetota bacterium]